MISGICVYYTFNRLDQNDLDLSSWNNSAIKNFSSYKYIGAGISDNNAGKTTRASFFFNEDISDSSIKEKEALKLIGITGTGTCEEVELMDANGDTVKQNVNLVYFHTIGRFSIVSFSNTYSEFIEHVDNSTRISYDGQQHFYFIDGVGDTYSFLIDNTTGRLYAISQVFYELSEGSEFSGANMELYDNAVTTDYLYVYCNISCDKDRGGTLDYRTTNMLKITAKGDKLIVEPILNEEQLINAGGGSLGSILKVDPFGNVIFRSNNMSFFNGENCFFGNTTVMKPSYSFTTLEEVNDYNGSLVSYSYFISYSGVIIYYGYLTDSTYCAYLDENCTFKEIDYLDLVSPKTLKGDDDTYYGLAYSAPGIPLIKEITYDSERPWVYTIVNNVIDCDITGTQYEDFINTSVISNGHICGFSGDYFIDYEIASNTMSKIDCGVKIKQMDVDGHYKLIKFDGVVKTTQKNVSGYLDLNKTGAEMLVLEDYSTVFGPIRVYTITPIN